MKSFRPVAIGLSASLAFASVAVSASPGQAVERQNCGVQMIDGRGAAMLSAQGVSCNSAWKTVKQAYRAIGGSGTAKVGGFTCKISSSGAYGAEKGSCKRGSSKISWMVAP